MTVPRGAPLGGTIPQDLFAGGCGLLAVVVFGDGVVCFGRSTDFAFGLYPLTNYSMGNEPSESYFHDSFPLSPLNLCTIEFPFYL